MDREVERLARPARRRRPVARSAPAARARRRRARPPRARAAVSCSEPVIRRTSSRGVQPPRSSVATVSPERMTVMRSPISLISSMRCVMKMTPTPSRAEARRPSRRGGRASRRRAPRSPRRGSGSRGLAQQRAHDAAGLAVAQRELLDRRVEVERARPSSSVKHLAGARALLARAGRARARAPSVPSQTLSSTERASATSTSWKTVTMPSSCAERGVRGAAQRGARRARACPRRARGRR